MTVPTEKQCQATIVEAAKTLGYLVHHTRPAQSRHGWRTPVQGDVGFPDLVIAGHGKVFVVELKRKPNRVDVRQQTWIDTLGDAGIHATVVWVPDGMQAFIDELARWAVAARRAG